jgi:hypothetical protein
MEEVVEAIRHEPWRPAELGKLECRKDFVYNANWNQRDAMRTCLQGNINNFNTKEKTSPWEFNRYRIGC